MNFVIRPVTTNDIESIQEIAFATWPVAYGSILSHEQLEYMLDKFYSKESLENQIKENHFFHIAFFEEKPVGFASFSKIEAGIFKLQKLYVLPITQKTGLGLRLLKIVENEARKMEGSTLQLNVNKNNNAKLFYLRNGFEVIREEDIDIGQGYFMNDFIMEKNIL